MRARFISYTIDFELSQKCSNVTPISGHFLPLGDVISYNQLFNTLTHLSPPSIHSHVVKYLSADAFEIVSISSTTHFSYECIYLVITITARHTSTSYPMAMGDDKK